MTRVWKPCSALGVLRAEQDASDGVRMLLRIPVRGRVGPARPPGSQG